MRSEPVMGKQYNTIQEALNILLSQRLKQVIVGRKEVANTLLKRLVYTPYITFK